MTRIEEFSKTFPDDDACLEFLLDGRNCPECDKKLFRIRSRPSYTCSNGHQFYPKANTIFHKSPTPLSLWFYTIALMSEKNITAKELERNLGVTYKCAWRIRHKIKQLKDMPKTPF